MGVLLFYLLIALLFNPIVWIIVAAVIYFSRKSKKKKAKEALEDNNTESTNRSVTASRPPNPMAKWNWLLYIGSFLIVLAMIYFIDSVNDSFVAPSTIILTIIIYLTGAAIHLKIDYLRPVGKAFVYSALCMIPLWSIAFSSMKMPNELISFFVTLSLMAATFIGTVITNHKFMAYLAFLSVIPFLVSFAPIFGISAVNSDHYWYFIFLSPMIAAFIPALLHISKTALLPKVFDNAEEKLGIVLMPLAFCFSLFLLFIPNTATNMPLLRTLCALLFFVYALIFYAKKKTRGFLVMLRFAIQAIIITTLFDLTDFSLTTSYGDVTNIGIALVCIIVWLLTFMGQIIYSLYCRKDKEEDERIEHGVSIGSFLAIFATPIMCHDFSTVGTAAVWLTICFIIAGLGVLHATHYKNVSWSIATAASIMVIPLIIGNYLATPKWDGSLYLICYTLIAILFLLGTYALRMIQQKEADTIGAISVVTACLAIISSAEDIQMTYAGFIISAFILAGFAFISKKNVFYEVAIYTGAVGLMSLSNDLIAPDRRGGSMYVTNEYVNYTALRSIVNAHIIGLAFLGTSWLSKYAYKKIDKARFIIGYSFFSVMMTSACSSLYSSSSSVGFALLFLVEQVAALLYAVFKKINWLIWFSSIEILIVAFMLTSGYSFLWLGLIGISLIAIVIWQLNKANKANIEEKKPEKN